MSVVAEPEGFALSVHRNQPGAFERLVEAHEPSLFRYVERLLPSATDAEEVVQDTFLRAHRALTRQYTEDRCRELALKPWLFRIARNLAFNKGRRRATKLEVPLTVTDDDHLRGLTRGASAVAEIQRREEMQQLDAAISQLPAEYRELIVLRFIEEMSYAEISRTIGGNEASLRGKVFRSLKLLRDVLGSKGVVNALP